MVHGLGNCRTMFLPGCCGCGFAIRLVRNRVDTCKCLPYSDSYPPLPPKEEKELQETLQEIIGQGKKAKLEQKIDPSIQGGLVVEFGQKVFDISLKTRAKQMGRFLREPVHLDGI